MPIILAIGFYLEWNFTLYRENQNLVYIEKKPTFIKTSES